MQKRMWQVAVLGLIALFFVSIGSIADAATAEERIAKLEAEMGALKGTVETVAKYQGETARALNDTVNVVNEMSKAVSALRQESATKAELAAFGKAVGEQVAAVRSDLGRTDATVARVADSTDERLRKLEKKVVGVRQVVARVGALEDRSGIDYAERLFRLSGFATASSELSSAMKKELGKAVQMVESGQWKVVIVGGFADSRPFKDDKDGKKNEELATNRAKAVAEYLGEAIGSTVASEGRGATTKFGGLDMNRSVLIYLERSSAPPAPAKVAPATPAAPAAPPAKVTPTPQKP